MAKVILTVTCDWDALDYEYTNYDTGTSYVPPERFNNGVGAVKKFHELFGGEIPITHFICPAYFTRKSKHEATYAEGMNTLAKRGDEVALHIHCWKSLVNACGVTFLDPRDKTVPDWGRTDDSPFGLKVGSDYGHGVPLGAYSYGDIVKLMDASRALLCKKVGIEKASCVSFRSGGWMTSDSVFKAVESLGFQYEASAVNYKFFDNKWETTLDKWLSALWGGGTSDEFLSNRRFRIPYHKLPTGPSNVTALQPCTAGLLVELPDTGVLADYVEVKWMKNHIKDAVKLASDSPQDIYISLGFHLESGGDTRFADDGFSSKAFGGKKFGETGCIGKLVEVLYWARETYGDGIAYQTIAQAGSKFLKYID
jgi:hypothetical protein